MSDYRNTEETTEFFDDCDNNIYHYEYVFMVILYPKPRKSIIEGTLNPSTRFFCSREEACEYIMNIAKCIYQGTREDFNVFGEENRDLFNYLGSLIKCRDNLMLLEKELKLFNHIPSDPCYLVNHIEIKKVPNQQNYIKSSNKK